MGSQNSNQEQGDRRDTSEALGQSDAFLDFQERLSRVAKVDRPVLLVGERGTGKELAASRVHFLSKRWEGPFVALNCSALAPTLIEAELFGHEAGAFTGATGRRRGRFEAAHGGTLFLDEIGNIPLQVQEKILRAVEYGSFERVGASQPISVEVRIVGATNADLRAKAARGEFMPDLLDRISFEVLVLPALRERPEDISLLANHFAARMAYELGWAGVPEITEDAMQMLLEFPWPGNVRELKNVIERAVYRSNDMQLGPEDLIFDPFAQFAGQMPADRAASAALSTAAAVSDGASVSGAASGRVAAQSPSGAAGGATRYDLSRPFNDCVRDLELGLLRLALERAKYNQKKAADHLQLTYHQFRGLYRKYQDDVSR
jgi:psp operon transcriptional activator